MGPTTSLCKRVSRLRGRSLNGRRSRIGDERLEFNQRVGGVERLATRSAGEITGIVAPAKPLGLRVTASEAQGERFKTKSRITLTSTRKRFIHVSPCDAGRSIV